MAELVILSRSKAMQKDTDISTKVRPLLTAEGQRQQRHSQPKMDPTEEFELEYHHIYIPSHIKASSLFEGQMQYHSASDV